MVVHFLVLLWQYGKQRWENRCNIVGRLTHALTNEKRDHVSINVEGEDWHSINVEGEDILSLPDTQWDTHTPTHTHTLTCIHMHTHHHTHTTYTYIHMYSWYIYMYICNHLYTPPYTPTYHTHTHTHTHTHPYTHMNTHKISKLFMSFFLFCFPNSLVSYALNLNDVGCCHDTSLSSVASSPYSSPTCGLILNYTTKGST